MSDDITISERVTDLENLFNNCQNRFLKIEEGGDVHMSLLKAQRERIRELEKKCEDQVSEIIRSQGRLVKIETTIEKAMVAGNVVEGRVKGLEEQQAYQSTRLNTLEKHQGNFFSRIDYLEKHSKGYEKERSEEKSVPMPESAKMAAKANSRLPSQVIMNKMVEMADKIDQIISTLHDFNGHISDLYKRVVNIENKVNALEFTVRKHKGGTVVSNNDTTESVSNMTTYELLIFAVDSGDRDTLDEARERDDFGHFVNSTLYEKAAQNVRLKEEGKPINNYGTGATGA